MESDAGSRENRNNVATPYRLGGGEYLGLDLFKYLFSLQNEAVLWSFIGL